MQARNKQWNFLKDFEDKIWQVNEELKEEFADSNDYITFTFLSIGSAFQGTEVGSHSGNITISLRDMEGAPISSFDISNRVRDKIGTVPEAQKLTVGGFNRFGKPVAISLLGKNQRELELSKRIFK